MTSAGNVYEDVDRDMHVDSEPLVWCYTYSGNELFMSENKMGAPFLGEPPVSQYNNLVCARQWVWLDKSRRGWKL